jgi:hypothetical protein
MEGPPRQVQDQFASARINSGSDMLSKLLISFQSEVALEIQACDVI